MFYQFDQDQINLNNVWDQPIETLSKGYKRRVGIAQALIHDPELLVLDEPTDGLDPNQKFEMRNLIQSISKKKGIIISISTFEEKVGVAVGVTSDLTSKFDAVKFVETGSEIVGGKGGGGRADFAQAGGVKINKIDEAFEKLKSLI